MPTQEQADEAYKHLVEQGIIKEQAPPDMTKLRELTKRLTEAEAQADVALKRVVSCPDEGYHFCAHPKCTTQISDGGPTVCPQHSPPCPTCKGRAEIIHSWDLMSGKMPRHKKCPTCNGTGMGS